MNQESSDRENRLRAIARRQGLQLRKNRRRDARAADYGSYMLVNPDTEWMVADFGWDRVGFPDGDSWLDDIEAYLTSDRDKSASSASTAGEQQ